MSFAQQGLRPTVVSTALGQQLQLLQGTVSSGLAAYGWRADLGTVEALGISMFAALPGLGDRLKPQKNGN